MKQNNILETMKCNKCDSSSTVVLRKNDHYCDNCFLTSTHHKFRACIGKNKILSKNDRVLICISGGPGSTVLLDMVHHGISLDIHKKLRIVPNILHVIDENNCKITDVIKTQCAKYNFNVFFIHVSNYLQQNSKLPNVNCLPEENTEVSKEFQAILTSMPATVSNDFLKKVKRSLYIQYAQLLGCKYVFTGETTSTLAINLLANLASGRGSQVENDIGFIDSRDKNVKILRPMKDISKEELNYYIEIKALIPADIKDVKSNSLQTTIGAFVSDLQENYQSTVSAVCRTADKIGVANVSDGNRKCAVCESNINNTNNKLSALDATIFSRMVSHGKLQPNNESLDASLFPYLNKHLCYSCSRNCAEMKYSSPGFQNVIHESVNVIK